MATSSRQTSGSKNAQDPAKLSESVMISRLEEWISNNE